MPRTFARVLRTCNSSDSYAFKFGGISTDGSSIAIVCGGTAFAADGNPDGNDRAYLSRR